MSEIYGRDKKSVPFWEEEAAVYRENLGGSRSAYHEGRLTIARRLLDQAGLVPGARVIDFGCGDGVFSRELAREGYEVLGIDPAEAMIALADDQNDGSAEFAVGGAAALAEVGPCQAIVTLNVLAYLTDEEMATFWDALADVLEPGGVLVVSHSNELFDMFALNGGTSAFFAEHFTGGEPVASLLTAGDRVPAGYNVRANPLTFHEELAAHGLEQEAQAFFNLHPRPPALLGEGDEGRVLDPDAIARVPLWKQQFQCSTMFALARRPLP